MLNYNYSLFKEFITKSIITSFSLGFDSAIKRVSAANVLLSIIDSKPLSLSTANRVLS